MAVTLLLAGCAGQQQGADSWTRWVCDSQAEVLWRFADSGKEQVEVRLAADDRVYSLQRQPSASGALYSDGRLTFHSKGAQGLVYWAASDDLIGRGCKAP